LSINMVWAWSEEALSEISAKSVTTRFSSKIACQTLKILHLTSVNRPYLRLYSSQRSRRCVKRRVFPQRIFWRNIGKRTILRCRAICKKRRNGF
jgi:hypothetical protein